MIGGRELYAAFGDPTKVTHMTMWDVPEELRQGAIPRRIYCHKLLVPILIKAFSHLITRGYVDELKTWDGCFNIRPIRGYERAYQNHLDAHQPEEAYDLLSTHSWGVAIDINAATNRLGQKPTMSAGFVKCFTDAGLEWGGSWKRQDGMHFQIRSLSASLS